jgi:large subunit ribosomal protein L31
MRAEIHPKVFEVVATCVCGGKFPTISTRKEISIDVCSNCHPFYTGKNRMLDTEGRVSRFEKKYKHLKDPIGKAKKKDDPKKDS